MAEMLAGIFTALVTPFRRDGAIDWPAFEALIEEQLAAGISGLVPCGTTGEASSLSMEEHVEVVRFAVARVGGRVPIVAGTGSNSTREAVELTRAAREAGADAVLSVTPYYNRPQPNGLIVHYRAVAAVGLPVVLYNIPSRTGLGLTAEDYRNLATIPGIVATKEASGDLTLVDEVLADDRLVVLGGDDARALPLFALGARGLISVASHIVARELIDLHDLVQEGQLEGAREVHRRLLPIFRALFAESNPAPLKAALAAQGRIEDVLRPPLVAAGEGTRERLARAMEEAGVGV